MTAATRALVRQRADHRCEYCQIHQEDSPLAALHIEHIRPVNHGGTDDESNLGLACIDCNLHKGSNLTGELKGKLPSAKQLADIVRGEMEGGK